uniref:LITAF domain-containing protein n=1 Tax=Acrobeloides nanus TaxID=290746 RepID=A0A914DSE7_9BILA
MFSTGVRIESWMLGCLPARVVCQRCKQEVVTQLGYETSSEECVKSILLFLLCLPLGAHSSLSELQQEYWSSY